MAEDYTIENLEKTFKEHAEKNIKNYEKDIESFKIKYPSEKLPDHYIDYFNISEALHVICKEINQLKEKNAVSGMVKKYKEILNNFPID